MRRLDGAHVEYCRGLRNPVGVKLGPSTDAGELVRFLAILDPTRSPGRVTLITRLGAVQVERVLPRLIAAVKASGHVPVWMCDPCHGNTFSTADGVKTRMVETVAAEVRKTFEVHARCGSHLGGLHLEQTGEEVTECVERAQALNDAVSFPHYRSLCDPRLSPGQAMKVVQALTAAAARGADDEIALLPATAHAVGEQAAEVRLVVEQTVKINKMVFKSRFPEPEPATEDVFRWIFDHRRDYPSDRVIYRVDGSDETLTVAELERKSRQFAYALVNRYSVKPGDTIGILASDSVHALLSRSR